MKKLKIGCLVNFKKAKLPNKTRLLGKYTILEPLQIKRHSTVLFNTFLKDKSKNIWTYMPYGPFKNLKTFVAYLKKYCLIHPMDQRNGLVDSIYNRLVQYVILWEIMLF